MSNVTLELDFLGGVNSAVASVGVRPDLLDSMARLFGENRDQELVTLWDMARALSRVT